MIDRVIDVCAAMKTKLYLQGFSDDTSLRCSLPSSTILFFVRYCQTKQFELIFIGDYENDSDMWYDLDLENFSDLEMTFTTWNNVPGQIRNVLLPSLHQPDLSLIRSGLCIILRHIIKESHLAAPNLHLIDLLGFRQGSMKMCAEVSGWTKLCEVELPQSISELISSLKVLKREKDFSKNTQTPLTLPLPCDLMKLEGHFLKKCKVHNDNKKLRAELVRLKKWLSDRSRNSSKTLAQDDSRSENTVCRPNCTVEKKNEVTKGSSFSPTQNGNKDSDVPSLEMSLEKLSLKGAHLQIEQTVHLHHGTRKMKIDKIFDKLDPSGANSEQPDGEKTGLNAEESEFDTKSTLDACKKGMAAPSSVMELVEKLTCSDIEYLHTYSEGIEMTLADLILFAYIYLLLEALDFNCDSLVNHIPSILQWAHHMSLLSTVCEAGQIIGWDTSSLAAGLNRLEGKGKGRNEPIPNLNVVFTFDKEDLPEDEEDMELSRFARMKHKAIKPKVVGALKKFEMANIQPVIGEHPRGENVQVDWNSLPLEVHPKEGDVPEKRTRRKCQQLENLVTAVLAVAKPGDILVDFCSGGGHLGIIMAYLLPECQVYLVENKEESLLKACARLESLKLKNVTLYQCNLDYFTGKFDVGTCLHACGTATDMVLQLCLNSSSSFVICPCCYGSIQNTHLLSYPRSQQFLQTNITYKDFLTLGHAADQTEFNIALEDQGRQCMNLVDTDRAQFARELGYTVSLCSLQPLSCTPKNNLLIGTPCQGIKTNC